MSDANDPPRLASDPRTSASVRDALDAARADLPSDAELASLAARLGPLLVPPGGGGAAPPHVPASGSLAAKAIGLLAAAASAGAIVWWAASPDPPHHAHEAQRETHVEARAPEPPPIPEGVDVPALPIDEPAREAPRPAKRRAPPRFESDPEAELALIRSAQDALETSPQRALELTDEHRRRFGDGTLAQEREVVAIDALTRLHRDDSARDRADTFRRRWPGSAHRRRIDVLVPPAER